MTKVPFYRFIAVFSILLIAILLTSATETNAQSHTKSSVESIKNTEIEAVYPTDKSQKRTAPRSKSNRHYIHLSKGISQRKSSYHHKYKRNSRIG